MNVIVAGSRGFYNYDILRVTLDSILFNQANVKIICGEARGADALGKRYAKEHGIEVLSFPANWDKYGKSAGYRRNREMAAIADSLVAFWDGSSKGTANMIDIMQRAGKPVKVVRY